jgi:glutathione synthase
VNVLFVTDAWETLDHSRDTSLRLMEEFLRARHCVYLANNHQIEKSGLRVRILAKKILKVGPMRTAIDFKFGALQAIDPARMAQIHYRVDPPVDLRYLWPLQMLASAPGVAQRIVNPLHVLLGCNEKWEGLHYPGLSPRSLISRDAKKLMEFASKLGTAVVKPLHLAQSRGVEKLLTYTIDDVRRSQALLEAATESSTHYAMVQEYLAAIEEGETRLWFLDAKLLGTLRKYPLSGDFRVQIDQGSRVSAHSPTPKELQAAKKIALSLKKYKIRLAAVDLVDGKIIDFNFTSPGLLVELEELHGEKFAAKIVSQLSRPFRK